MPGMPTTLAPFITENWGPQSKGGRGHTQKTNGNCYWAE